MYDDSVTNFKRFTRQIFCKKCESRTKINETFFSNSSSCPQKCLRVGDGTICEELVGVAGADNN